MKKILFFASTIVAMAIAGGCSTKVSKYQPLIDEACDSLDSITSHATADSVIDTNGKVWPVWTLVPDYDKWYDSLTTLIVTDFDDWTYNNHSESFQEFVYREFYSDATFMHQYNRGWDGLCDSAVYTKHQHQIDAFYENIHILDSIRYSSKKY